jgi:hypothetical protein
MLNFLRKTRNRLLKEGNLKVYLTYAVGEILIVVVGILLALYLNNWNQKRTNNKQEIQYYQSMKNQLNEDMYAIIGNMDYNQNFLNQFSYAKNLILSNDKNKIDTLGKIALNLLRFSDFRRKSSIYQTLVNSGEIKNINNNKIIEELQSLEEIYIYINRLEETHLNFILSQIVPNIMQVFLMDPFKIKDPKILYSYQFQNKFDLLIGLMMEKMEAYNQAKIEISFTIELIDQELKD